MKDNLTYWSCVDDAENERLKVLMANHSVVHKNESRLHIKESGYKSVLDCGAGYCSEYYGFKSDGYDIDYYAFDITPRFVKTGVEKGINIREGDIENIPYGDDFVDVCLCHAVLNHLEDFKRAIDEMLRVAKKEVIVSFFKKFQEVDEIIYRYPNCIYHYYVISDIQQYLNKKGLNYQIKETSKPTPHSVNPRWTFYIKKNYENSISKS